MSKPLEKNPPQQQVPDHSESFFRRPPSGFEAPPPAGLVCKLESNEQPSIITRQIEMRRYATRAGAEQMRRRARGDKYLQEFVCLSKRLARS